MKTILILSVNPPGTTRLRLDREVREIQDALRRSKYRDCFQVVTAGAVRVEDLTRALLEYQPAIVHFSGHGVGTEGLVLENESGDTKLVSSESLGYLFKLFQTKVECVLLNACYSEIQAQVIHHYIDYLIGMNRPIGDEAAIKFSLGFYDALGAGEPYERCFEIGRASIDLQGIPETETPQLKARPRAYSLAGVQDSEPLEKSLVSAPPVSKKTVSQTFKIKSKQISNNEIAQSSGDNVVLTQTNNSKIPKKSLTVPEVLGLIHQIYLTLDRSELPDKYKQKAVKHLQNAQEEIEEEEPDKDFAAKNLQKLTKVLKEAEETTQLSESLLQKLDPIYQKLLLWLEAS
ncbi:CHAT domain-containing protein [Laspinema sp. A4]|uniref:CHAT domain-containing protein n=1 Tax=Laspinema sp. D2d TaxID=2953686 RepID=UPI0021BA48B5|nr:CHAT domain-containing protein [Laspinema sp. D2d]MCT7984067.1 CHAT domain-containing protein [Laspinema sp. D2d]